MDGIDDYGKWHCAWCDHKPRLAPTHTPPRARVGVYVTDSDLQALRRILASDDLAEGVDRPSRLNVLAGGLDDLGSHLGSLHVGVLGDDRQAEGARHGGHFVGCLELCVRSATSV